MLERVRVPQATQVAIDIDSDGLGPMLKLFFDGVTASPLPDRLTKLADELEAAFERGDLCRVS